MCPRTSCPLSSWTLNIVFGRASTISPSISIFSSLGTSGDASDEAYVLRLRVLRERLEALPVDARVVDEQVPVTIIGSDESVALLVVEPLDGSGRHVNCPFLRVPGTASPDAPAYADYAGLRRPDRRDATSSGARKPASAAAQLRSHRGELVLPRRLRPRREPQAVSAPAREDVDVEVENLLVGGRLGAVEQVDALAFEALTHPSGEPLGRQVRGVQVVVVDLVEVARVAPRHDERMPPRPGQDVEERDRVLVLVHHVRWLLAGDDRAEDAVVGHGRQPIGQSQVRTSTITGESGSRASTTTTSASNRRPERIRSLTAAGSAEACAPARGTTSQRSRSRCSRRSTTRRKRSTPSKSSSAASAWRGCRNMPRTFTASPTRPSQPAIRGVAIPQSHGSVMKADRSPVPKRTRGYSGDRTVTTTSPSPPSQSASPVSGSQTWTRRSSGRCNPRRASHSSPRLPVSAVP